MVTATINNDGMQTGMALLEKTFSSGKTGFFAQGKVTAPNGDRYQTQIQMVKIVKAEGTPVAVKAKK